MPTPDRRPLRFPLGKSPAWAAALDRLTKNLPAANVGRRAGAAALLALLLGCSLAGRIDPWLDTLGRGYVTANNDNYLKEAEGRAVETFLILSALKGGLAVLQSSEAGISLIVQMKVQVGNVIASLADTVDAGWRVSLVSLSAIYGTRILLKLTCAASGPLMSLLLVVLLIHLVTPLGWRKVRRSLWSAGGVLTVLTVTAGALLPLSVFLGSVVSRRITAPLADESKAQIETVHQELAGDPPPADVRAHVQSVLERFKTLSRRIDEKISLMGRHVAQRIAVTLFDVFVFPLLFLWPSVLLVRSAARHFFEHPPLPPAEAAAPQRPVLS